MTSDMRRLVYANINLINSKGVVVKANGNTYRPEFKDGLFSGWKKISLGGVSRDPTVTTPNQPNINRNFTKRFCLNLLRKFDVV